jgi:hypothetical protein
MQQSYIGILVTVLPRESILSSERLFQNKVNLISNPVEGVDLFPMPQGFNNRRGWGLRAISPRLIISLKTKAGRGNPGLACRISRGTRHARPG